MTKMKTTENISLAGYAFTIETDAYKELETYLDDIHEVFGKDASADEIRTDIEERIAELLREKCVNGMVVDMGMIQEIEKRIGDPKTLSQQDTEEVEDNAAKQPKKEWRQKRLYRNMEERMIGGVCSGLGSYFGLDKVIFRIVFLTFFLLGFIQCDDGPFFGLSILAYLCLWIAMPAARTNDQKREMKGRPKNLENYRNGHLNIEKEVKDIAQSPAGKTIKRAGGVFLGLMLLVTGLGGMLGCILVPAVPTIISAEIMEEVLEGDMLDIEEQFFADIFLNTEIFWIFLVVMLGIMFIWCIYNGVMLLFNLKYPSWRPGLVLFIAWLISVFITCGWAIKMILEHIPAFMA